MRRLALVAIVMFLVVPVYADPPSTITFTLDDMVDQPALSLDWSVEAIPLVTDTGAGAGKINFQELTITKNVDKSSSKIFQHCVRGTHFPDTTIVCRKAGESQKDFLVIKLKDIVITRDKVNSKGNAPTETISFSYGSAEVQYPGGN